MTLTFSVDIKFLDITTLDAKISASSALKKQDVVDFGYEGLSAQQSEPQSLVDAESKKSVPAKTSLDLTKGRHILPRKDLL